jgi:prepilin-type N-terminal cleavage/methylation domain-containing protein
VSGPTQTVAVAAVYDRRPKPGGHRPPLQGGAAGFSLIELLVVIGIIVIMIGALGLALRGGGGNVGLQSAQGTLGSLLTAARAQAAVSQQTAMLVIDADPAKEGFLRTVHVAVQAGSGWNFVSDATLPPGVYLVPGSRSVTGADCSAAWPATRLSTVADPANFAVAQGGVSGLYLVTNFTVNSVGTPSTAGAKLIVAAGRRTSATALVFDNPELVRGVILSAYGAPILINNAAGFDN